MVLLLLNSNRRELKIPKAIKFVKRELPPYDTKGSVIPTMGTSPIFIPILTKACVKNRKKNPITIVCESSSCTCCNFIYKVKRKKAKRPIINAPPTNPRLSEIVAKIKSVCRSGKN